jgi:hypothetical protein
MEIFFNQKNETFMMKIYSFVKKNAFLFKNHSFQLCMKYYSCKETKSGFDYQAWNNFTVNEAIPQSIETSNITK